jgi:hypothetical protein
MARFRDRGQCGDERKSEDSCRDGLIFYAWHVGDEHPADSLSAENTAADDGRLSAYVDDIGGVDCADYGGPENGHGVVDHGGDGGAGDNSDIADIFEEAGWDEGVFYEVGFCKCLDDVRHSIDMGGNNEKRTNHRTQKQSVSRPH